MPPDDGLRVEVSFEEFEKYTPSQQNYMLVGAISRIEDKTHDIHSEGCKFGNDRDVENQKTVQGNIKKQLFLSGVTGLVGGVLVMLGKGRLW